MPLNNLRSRLGRDGPEQQRVDADEINEPDEIQDPTTFRDEATPTLKERLKNNKFRLIGSSFLILAALGFTLIQTRRYLPELYTHPATTRGLPLAILLVGAFFAGTKHIRQRLRDLDWLILVYPRTHKLYLGEFKSGEDGTEWFEPSRGFSLLGGTSHHYELAEVSEKLANSAAKKERDPTDPVRIGIPQGGMTRKTGTWFGTVGSVITDQLIPVKETSQIDFIATGSSNEHDELLEEYKDRFMMKKRENERLENRIEDLQEELDQAKIEAKQKREEIRKEEREHMKELFLAARSPSKLADEVDEPSVSTNGYGSGSSNGMPEGIRKELEEIDA